ncbi:MAG: hypothetical protein JW829_20020 [Pirellulales bacterium]|nr:hypothetical protein [Pirellulales bacterium]
MRSTYFSAFMVVAAMAGPAEARLFAYTFGAQCCVDHYHYFRCSRSLAIGGGSCEYRGYCTPRYCDSGFYCLYGCNWSPQNNLSAGYSCCHSWDGCRWGWFGLGSDRPCSPGLYHPVQPRSKAFLGYENASPGLNFWPADASHSCQTGSGHLYDMLFEMPAGRPPCSGYSAIPSSAQDHQTHCIQ